MGRRHARYGAERRPRRFAVFSLATLAVLGAAAWLAPTVAVLTRLRDRPLEAAFAGIGGSVSSGSARWAWLGPVEFRDVVVRDRSGAAVAVVPELVIDRGLLQLAVSPRDLGTIRLVGPEVVVAVRPGGSSFEDVLAPWLAQSDSAAPACTVEIVDGVVELVDLPRGDAWRLGDLFAAVALGRDGAVAGWTVGGRVRHAGRAAAAVGTTPANPPPPRRLDRSTVVAGAAAALARDGGFSCSDGATGPGGSRTLTVAAHRLPLGASSVVATRFGGGHVADGLAEVRLDVEFAADGPRIEGTVETAGLVVCRADTLAEVLTIDSLEVPVDVTLAADHIAVRKLAAVSGLFRAEASGRIRLPAAAGQDWVDGLAADDFALAADVDLAAVARGLAGGITVRPDVHVTAGRLEIAAASRPDGEGRLLEVRAAARDLAAEQDAAPGAADASAARQLRWTEPFAGWIKARRGPTGGLRLDEARVTSGALEVTAAGSADAATLQWTCDLGRLAAEAAEVVDLAGASLAGTSRGRVEVTHPTATGPGRVTVAANLEDFELAVPGRPAWRDEALSLEADAAGRLSAGSAGVESAHAVVVAGEDRLEATLTGGTIVDLAGLLRGRFALRPAAVGAAAAADVSIAGELARWHARLAPLLPAAATEGVEVGGRVRASVAAVARGDAWEVTRAGAEIERLAVAASGRQVTEPRLVAAAEGLVRPLEGRVDVASAEVLTATVSLRTAGLAWRSAASGPGWRERLRGKLQWQADVGRIERWLLDPAITARWPATGRAWGTLELVDGAAGLDIVAEMTGSQLAIAEAVPGEPAAPPRPVWAEPQATLAVEVTVLPGGPEAVRIERLALDSSTLSIRARGGAGGAARTVELDGTVACDWQQVSKLVGPWMGGAVQLAGAGGRPFAVRGRFGGPPPAPALPPAAATLPLPPEWASAARAGSGTDEHAARVTLPVAARRPSSLDLFRALAIDTSIAWQAADVAGFPVAPGEIPVRLVEGQLAFGPFDLGVAGGRVRSAPWVGLVGTARELVVPAGRLFDRVSIAGPPARRFTSWLSPLVGHAAHTSGLVSVDLAGARLPLADPFAGLVEARVQFEALEVTPDGPLVPLTTLLSKLQALVDPRLALGDRPVLMRVRPDPVLVRLVERRLWHEGLVLDAGQLMVRSGGSVGADGSLAMVVEVSLRGDVAGQTPVVAQLLRTPLAIPLKGTVERPQFDARAIDTMLAKIVENTAQAVIGDGIVRGLDALLGGQQPPAPPPAPPSAPLVLPQSP